MIDVDDIGDHLAACETLGERSELLDFVEEHHPDIADAAARLDAELGWVDEIETDR